jgi:hypothetical protein
LNSTEYDYEPKRYVSLGKIVGPFLYVYIVDERIVYTVKTDMSYLPIVPLSTVVSLPAGVWTAPLSTTALQPLLYVSVKDHTYKRCVMEAAAGSGKAPLCYSVAEVISLVAKSLVAWNTSNNSLSITAVSTLNPTTVSQYCAHVNLLFELC